MKPTDHRRGVTLLELLIVAVIMVAATSVAVPTVRSIMGRQPVMQAVGDVARFLEDNRRRAIIDGVPRWVRLESNGPGMLAGPGDAAGDSSEELLDGCAFERFDLAEKLTGPAEDSATAAQNDVAWSSPITYFPDGTATELNFAVRGETGRARPLRVSGLTGRTVLVREEP